MATVAGNGDVERVRVLDNVLTRLALTGQGSMQQVLNRLLPAVIRELSKGESVPVLNKVVEILSHVNKTVAAQDNVTLPVEDLIQICYAKESSQKARNFAFMYLEKVRKRDRERPWVADAPDAFDDRNVRRC